MLSSNVSFPEKWLSGGAGNKTTFLEFTNSLVARLFVGNVRNSLKRMPLIGEK
ncbi:hypothetical protein GILI108418_15075 [Gillisia limnaea]|uniref:Uncharacterized protein n=1 Tax=Gillisia limnaea (strain DSM 15749 / LMG 21470 / R-8282) TaxID=865937 RepID=H2BZE1_GILLR|nr:hypothetical protein Gilli_1657 [Gillisia limnaea DSM 15749]